MRARLVLAQSPATQEGGRPRDAGRTGHAHTCQWSQRSQGRGLWPGLQAQNSLSSGGHIFKVLSLFACETQQGFNRETQVTRSVVCKRFTWKNQSRNPSGPGERRWRAVPRRSGSVQVAGGWEMGLWGFSAVVGGPTEPDLTKPTDFLAQEMMV